MVSEPAAAATRLSCTTEHQHHAVVMHPCGEVDAYTLPTWQRLLRAATATIVAPRSLVIDLDGLVFISCRGFSVLADEATRCRRRGVALHLVSDEPFVTRIITAANFTELLPVHSSTTPVDTITRTTRNWCATNPPVPQRRPPASPH